MNDNRQQTVAMALQPMRPGELLGTALRLYRRHWRTLIAIVAIAVPVAVSMPTTKAVPSQGGQFQVIVHHRVVATTASWTLTAVEVLSVIVGLLGFAVFVGAIARAAAAAVAGEDPGVRGSYRFGVARVWSLLRVIVMVVLLTMLGFIVLVVPGVFVGVMLAASVPALVVEGRRGPDALARSWNLVAGRWWHAFATIFVAWLLIGLATSLVYGVLGWVADGGWLAQTVAQAVAITLTTPFAALVGVLLYLDLRARRELADADVASSDPQASGG
jgi:hypothetical protein